MVVKYQCPKCNRRWADWGAEKTGFKCPNCMEEGHGPIELVRVGSADLKPAKRPSLKRSAARAAPVKLAPVVPDDEEALISDDGDDDTELSVASEDEDFEADETIEDSDEVFDEDEEDEESDEGVTEPSPDADDIELDDLPFGDVRPPLSGDALRKNDNEWEE